MNFSTAMRHFKEFVMATVKFTLILNAELYKDAKILADIFDTSLDTFIIDQLENEIDKYRDEIEECKNQADDFNQFRKDY